MTEYVYKVVDDLYEIYWLDDVSDIKNMFGTVIEVTRYRLVDPVDVTDDVNGDYWHD